MCLKQNPLIIAFQSNEATYDKRFSTLFSWANRTGTLKYTYNLLKWHYKGSLEIYGLLTLSLYQNKNELNYIIQYKMKYILWS